MTTNSTDADGYVVNATSDTDTVKQQVKGVNQSTTILKELRVGTTYSITVRAYQDILGPVSNTISVQTYLVIAPSGPPFNVRAYILNETSIKVNWTISSHLANGYVIVYIDSTGNRNVLSTTETEIITNNLPLSTYNISVYSYKHLPSVNSTQAVLKFNSKLTFNFNY